MCTEFFFEEIRAATNNWADENIMGEGESAVVYRGMTVTGQVWAVKRFKVCTSGFEDEVGVR